METSIGYLKTVHGDLLVAARSEAIRGAAPNGPRGPRRRRFSTARFATAAAAIVLLAGIIGGLIRYGSGIEYSADVSGGGGGAAGSTGAAGAGERAPTIPESGMGYLDAAPQASPAPGGGDQSVGEPTTSRIIRTGDISVIIPRDSFDDRFAAVVDAAEDNHGFVAESRSRERAGALTVRVPSARFDETLRAIRELGTVSVESVRGRDVTAEYVDLRARLRIEKSRREVLLRLMDQASSIEQTIRVRNALDETQLRIEQIQGQRRLLNDQTSFATITVDLREEGVAADVEAASIPNAFERAGAGFVGVIAAIIIGLGYLLPLVAIGLVIWFVVVQVRRRRRVA
ncbi:MAG TPA: DUF4349 domain-containing protein [Actinomycetota bacterium]|jgi:hypothetical protein|nr:DUF4349 domain-containing protein [Actinomycetota bacterium]